VFYAKIDQQYQPTNISTSPNQSMAVKLDRAPIRYLEPVKRRKTQERLMRK